MAAAVYVKLWFRAGSAVRVAAVW